MLGEPEKPIPSQERTTGRTREFKRRILFEQSLATVLAVWIMGFSTYAQVPGTQRWMIDVGSEIMTPAIANDGSICFCTDAGYFFSVSTNGTTNWMRQVGTSVASDIHGSSTAIAADGTIYFGTETGQFYSFTADGLTNWWITLPGSPSFFRCAPAIASDGTVYVSLGTFASSV